MVRPKRKTSRKVQRDAEPIVTTEPKSSKLVVTEESIPKPTVTMTEDPNVLRELLDAAPAVPYITNVESAVTFVDSYRRWMSRVKAVKR